MVVCAPTLEDVAFHASDSPIGGRTILREKLRIHASPPCLDKEDTTTTSIWIGMNVRGPRS
jgi:hypothetical protein